MGSNFGEIEGDWKNFRIKFVSEEDIEAVKEHVKTHFMRDETVCRNLGYSEEFGEEFANFIEQVLPDNLSLAVYDKASGKLAAVRITYVHTRMHEEMGLHLKSEQGKKIEVFLEIVDKAANGFEIFKADHFVDLLVASTAPEFRKQGIAGELYRRTFRLLKERKLSNIVVRLTSPYTRTAVAKFGFGEKLRMSLTEFQDGQMFPNATPDHILTVAVKSLKDNETF